MSTHQNLDLKGFLNRMTLQEKLAQLGSRWGNELQDGHTFSLEKALILLRNGIGHISRTAGGSAFEPKEAAAFNNSIQTFLRDHTRLGIPAIVHEECCSGYLGLGGTAFPQMIGLACSFSPDLAVKMAKEIRDQMRAVGAHQGLAPVLDVGRDPRWGRIEETFGEDPLLVSLFGAAYIQGLQGDRLSDGGVIATGKHFVGHSISQGGLNCAPVRMGHDDLWNVFLKPFELAIRKANLKSIMNAYPELDGEVVAASRSILTGLLRETLGFSGLLVSDYEAIHMIHTYQRMAQDKCEAAALALKAGIELELPTINCYGDPLLQSLEDGNVSLEMIDTSVMRVLQMKAELGLFENPFVDEGRVGEVFETPHQRNLAHDIARKSMVLLKNDGILPFSPHLLKVAVIGPNADDSRCLLSDYSYSSMLELLLSQVQPGPPVENFNRAHIAAHEVVIPTILGMLKQTAPSVDFIYTKGCNRLEPSPNGIDEALIATNQSDAVVLVLGDQSGLTLPCTTGETRDSADLTLPAAQEELAEAVVATGKPVAVVLVTGRPYAITKFAEKANAVLEAWLPGEEGAAAIAEILFGVYNPGGKLAISFPRHAGQTPIFYNQKPSGGTSNWYVDYTTVSVKPLFPFGHGLSYTNFEYTDFSINALQATAGNTIDIRVAVKNTGRFAGEEVVQLYVQDEYASSPRPVKELKSFARLPLGPGEQKIVTFHLPVNLLAFYNQETKLVLESGSFKIMLGSSSEDIRYEGELVITGKKQCVIDIPVFECPVSVEKSSH